LWKGKRIGTEREKELLDLMIKRGEALIWVDPLKCIENTGRTLSRVQAFDLRTVEVGPYAFEGTALLFSGLVSGLGIFWLADKLFQYAESFLDRNNVKQVLQNEITRAYHHLFQGTWKDIKTYDEDLIDQGLKIGEVLSVYGILWVHISLRVEQGRFDEAEALITRLFQIWEEYEHIISRIYEYEKKAYLSLKCRKSIGSKALTDLDTGISLAIQNGLDTDQIQLLGTKARTQIVFKDIEGARVSLNQENKLVQKNKGRTFNWDTYNFLLGQCLFDLELLQQAVSSGDKRAVRKHSKEAYRSAKAAKKVFAKACALGRTEFLRFMGTYYWLIGKEKKALKWWKKSIEAGELLGARLELSRTYMEIGKRLLEEKSRYKELNGISAEQYLEKAKTMFQDMDLQWDLEELERVGTGEPHEG
jgi:tetratricopeptide (TPR) repeat protein